MEPAVDPTPLRHVRLGKRIALLALLAGVVGALVLGIKESASPRGDEPDAAPAGGATPGKARVAAPTVAGPTPPSPSPAPKTRPFLVRVVDSNGPARDVYVRAVALGGGGEGYRALSAPGTTDPLGEAVLDLEDPRPSIAWLELASYGAEGFLHGFVSFDDLRPPAPGTPVVVRMPEGAPLRIELQGLPPDQRPASVDLELLVPFGPWLPMFKGVAPLPSEDGGVLEARPPWRRMRLRLGEDGVGVMPRMATDHAIQIDLSLLPEGWIIEAASSTGPYEETREGDVVRVPPTTGCVYSARFRPTPRARLTIVAKEGGALPSARVAAGLVHEDGAGGVFGIGMRTDVTGVGVVPLWTGSRLPTWVPKRLLLLAWAPGHLARILERAGAWSDLEETIELPAAPSGSFHVTGLLRHADGRPGPGLPLRLACAPPWNGQVLVDPIEAKTDGEGRFRFDVPESLRPLFAVTGRLQIALDQDRLESTAVDAFWRARWPTLPRMVPVPATFALPATGETTVADTQLSLP